MKIYGRLRPSSPMAKCLSRLCQAPADRQTWTVSATKENIIVEIPDRRPASARIVKQVVRLAVAVEIGSPLQLIPACNRRSVGAADKDVVVHVPNRCLACARVVKHIIRLAVRVEIAGRKHRGWVTFITRHSNTKT
jgi:hypothetical protein